MRITAKISVVIPAILLILLSCNKQNEWLDEPRKKEELTIKSVKDMQELLNNTTIFNTSMPAIGLIGCDNILVKDSELGRVNVIEKNAYLWTKDIYEGQISTDYFTAYKGIVYANVVLESLKNLKIESNDPASYRQISGQACFYRAYMYSELVNLFCKAYNSATANTDKGICIKRSSDVNQIVQRSSVLECYSQILEDATTASSLLGKTGLFTTQPTKLSAWGLLARVYLSMNNYEKSFQFADSVVKNNTQLIDFTF
ncbi:RagB/SusD family nutrient uptake outer membrane protein [uncultured Chitinophaga sp.]|uniref:RagB/SusD family nutrient uptake outer membrane protein n=1 Tax=uncultured Chitinophaga sp. TaxID=339340 RepID=UPI0026244B97|nr:RagB/SusD family nutrient uptake outer membrane protein [uncultured Chitinophaga sp.]